MLICDHPSAPDLPTLRTGTVTLRAPGRLHLGFLDPDATLGRRYGSLGLVIEGFETVVDLAPAAVDSVTAATAAAQEEAGRARVHLERLRQRTGCQAPLHLRLQQVLPAHAGFGSGTQLALAVARAFASWHGIDADTATLAQWLGRGLRSGIGIAGFDHGGLLLDGGPGGDGTAAPILSRLALPPAWRVLVVQDATRHGLSGSDERRAIAELPPLPRAAAADICHQVLMRVLPGAADSDFDSFSAGLTGVQRVLGAHFAPAQGGSAYTSPGVGALLEALAATTPAAVGQSSWGPTGFAILPSAAAADAAMQGAQAAGLVRAGLTLQVVRARNHGATMIRH